jgi:hypothetical protein
MAKRVELSGDSMGSAARPFCRLGDGWPRLFCAALFAGLGWLWSSTAADAQTITFGPNGKVSGTLPDGMGTFSGTVNAFNLTITVFAPNGQVLGTFSGFADPVLGPHGQPLVELGAVGTSGLLKGTFIGEGGLPECNVPAGGGKISGSGCSILIGHLPIFGDPPAQFIPALRAAASATERAQTEAVFDSIDGYLRRKSRQLAQAEGGSETSGAPLVSPSGIAAGSDDKRWTIWLDGSATHLDDAAGISTYSGLTLTTLLGIDYLYDTDWLFGFSAGYVSTNLHVLQIGGSRGSQGAVLGPYVSYIVNQHVTVDGILNYGRLDNNATDITGFGSNRYSAAISVNGFATAGAVNLTGYLGYTTAKELPDSGSASFIGGQPTRLYYSAVKLGGELAYPIGDFEPYIPVAVICETNDPHDGTGNVAVTGGAGVRYQLSDRIKAGVQLIGEVRSHYDSWGGGVNVRVAF